MVNVAEVLRQIEDEEARLEQAAVLLRIQRERAEKLLAGQLLLQLPLETGRYLSLVPPS